MLVYQVVLLFLLSVIFINPVFADINDMINFLPVEGDLYEVWQFGEIYAGKNVDTTISELKPDIVNQKFLLQNEASSMTVEINIYELDSKFEASQLHRSYSEFLSGRFIELPLTGKQSTNCFGIMNNVGYVNEMASIICIKNSFVIVASAQQEGGIVFENELQALTNNAASGFITFVLERIDKKVELHIPNWIKNNALWWGQDKINDNEFITGLQYLIQNNIIIVNNTTTSIDSGTIPYWIKNTALWWGEGKISDAEFIKSIEFLIENRFITI